MLPSFTNKCKFYLKQASQKQNDCKSLKVSNNFLDKCKSDMFKAKNFRLNGKTLLYSGLS